MHYVISDIHGCYNEFIKMLNLIDLKDDDILYILGDIFDRGPEPLKVYQYIKDKPNIKMCMGNHETFILEYFSYKFEPYNKYSFYGSDSTWFNNGGRISLKQISELPKDEIKELYEFIKNLPYYFEVNVNNTQYLLVHAGFYPEHIDNIKELMDTQSQWDLVWIRDHFLKSEYKYPFKTIIGHSPVQYIYNSIKGLDMLLKRLKQPNLIKSYIENQIIFFNNKIGIDGGCVFGGNLTCLRLEDEHIFVVPSEIKI